jgi:hypothetical protein
VPGARIADAFDEPGMPLASNLRATMQAEFERQGIVSAPLMPGGITPGHRTPARAHGHATAASAPIAIDAHDSVHEREAERAAAAMSASSAGSTSSESSADARPARGSASVFDTVRIHTGPRSAQAAKALRAQAFTLGDRIAFGAGQYAPDSEPGRRLLAHELQHVLQHRLLTAPRISRSPVPGEAATDPLLATLDTRDFRALWRDFERARDASRTSEALALVPGMLVRMSSDEAIDHAADLAFWLIDRGERTQAVQAVNALEHAWRIGYAANRLPVVIFGGFGLPYGPEGLVDRGETEAIAGQQETAHALLGVAHLMVQMQLDRLYRQAAADRALYAGMGEGGAIIAQMGAIMRDGDLQRLTALRTRILNVYPQLATSARDAGDLDAMQAQTEAGARLGTDLAGRYNLAEMADPSDLSRPLGAPTAARGMGAGSTRRSSGGAASSSSAGASSGASPALAPSAETSPEPGVETAAVVADTEAPRVPIGGAETDRTVNSPPPFNGSTTIAFPGNHYVYVRSERYAVSESLERAVSWARNLFGVMSSVVVMHADDDGVIRFYAAALDEDITGRVPAANPMRAVDVPLSVPLVSLPGHYDIMAIHVGNGVGLWPTPERAAAYFGLVARQAASAPGTAVLDREHVRREVFSEIDALMADDDKLEDVAYRLAQLDSMAFATLSQDQRFAYLQVLLRAWTYQAQERAVVEIMRSVESFSELQSIIARLREAGLWDALINDLDLELWSLLTTVGERFGGDALTLANLYQFMADAGFFNIGTPIPGLVIGPNGPEFDVDVIANIQEAALSFVRFVESMWDGIVMLLTQPDRVVQGLAQLSQMILVFKLAEYGYPPAMEQRDQIVRGIGRQLLNGFKGVVVLGVGEEVVRRLKWALIWEVASMFIGIGEVRAAIGAVSVSARTGAIARFLSLLGLAGRVAEGERAVSGLSRLAAILGRSSRLLRTEEEVLVALSHLPDDEAERLARALNGIELGEGMTLDALRAAHPQLAEVASASLQRAEALHRLATKLGGFSDDVARIFARISAGGHSPEDIARIAGLIPEGEGARFARVIGMVGDESALAGSRGLANLEMIAASTARMQAVERYGYRAIDSLMAYAEHEAAELDGYIAALARVEGELPEASRAEGFSHFVEAVADSDPDALRWLEDRVPGARRTPVAPTPPRPLTPFQETSIQELVDDYGAHLPADEMARIQADMRAAIAGRSEEDAIRILDGWEDALQRRTSATANESRLQRLLDRLENSEVISSRAAAEAELRSRISGRSQAEVDRIFRDMERRIEVESDIVESGRGASRAGDPEVPTQELPIGPREERIGPVAEPMPGARDAPRVEVGPAEIDAFRQRHPDLVASRDTVAVARSDIPGMEGELFEGGSPLVRREAGMPESAIGPIESPEGLAQARYHAEEDIANQFIARMEALGVREGAMEGRTLAVHISNPRGICAVCRGGLPDPVAPVPGIAPRAPGVADTRFWTSDEAPWGVLKQLSMRYPGLTIRVTVDGPTGAHAAHRSFVILSGAVF